MTEKFAPGAWVLCPACRQPYFKDQTWKALCLTCYLAKKGTAAPPAAPAIAAPIEPGMLRRLIQLCHPDRHGDSPASNEATRYLLGLKGAANG
jgi:hypothetical protein